MATSGFLTKLTENNCKENHFSVESFSEISKKLFLSLSCSLSKNNYFTGYSQFFLNMSGVCRNQSKIKIEPIAKIVNGSGGIFRTEWNI